MKNTIIEHKSGTAIILKVDDAIGVSYFICTLVSGGHWYRMEVNPWYEENDDLALGMLDLYLRKGSISGIDGIPLIDECHIRDCYLHVVHGDNFSLFEYKDHHIFHGWNDDSRKGSFFVTDAEGYELCSFDRVSEAKLYIDLEVKGENPK